jgi:hypothetical protein
MRVLQLSRLPDFFTRYDLAIQGTHNFVANGMVVHNTSAHLTWKDGKLLCHPGGESAGRFAIALGGDEGNAKLVEAFTTLGHADVKVYGEAYGGSQQKMKATYGDKLKFIVFEVQVGDTWLNVENAHDVAAKLGLEFVYYKRVPATVEALDAERDAPSVQAVRNGMGDGHRREGIVARPIEEMLNNRGERVICKHKRDEFKETATPRDVDPAQLKVLADAEAVAMEWVTDMRLEHVLQKFPEPHGIEITGKVVKAMVEDVAREGAGEFVDTPEARKAISTRASKMYRTLATKV